MRVSVKLAAILSATVMAAGCAAYRPCPYHLAKGVANCPGGGGGPLDESRADEYTLGFVEFDDQGWLWDRSQLEAVLVGAERAAQKGGAVIVVYVHGWHHSADEQDDDVQAFRVALADLNQALNEPEFKTLRAAAVREGSARGTDGGASGKATVFGIYVGWRGGSLPGNLDFLTFSERKRAAHRVGHGDVSELLVRLDRIHAKANDEGRYTGLVVVGHSFGGAVVYSAIADKLQIDLAAKQPTARAGTQPLAGTRCALDPQSCLNVIGDLVVLVNPAFEASLYHEVDLLAKSATLDSCQPPVLLVVSSEEDWPNRRFFPIGQTLLTQEQGVLRDAAQAHEVHRSLGNVPAQVTHCLRAQGGEDCTSTPRVTGRAAAPVPPPTPGQSAGAGPAAPVQRKDPCSEPLGRGGPFGDTYLYPVSASVRPDSPVMLVRATGELIPGHDLFARDGSRKKFVGFLVQFVHELMYQKFVLFKEKPKSGMGTPSP